MKKTKRWYINKIKKLLFKIKKLYADYLDTIPDEGNAEAKDKKYLSMTIFSDSVSVTSTNKMIWTDKIDMYWETDGYEKDYSKEE